MKLKNIQKNGLVAIDANFFTVKKTTEATTVHLQMARGVSSGSWKNGVAMEGETGLVDWELEREQRIGRARGGENLMIDLSDGVRRGNASRKK